MLLTDLSVSSEIATIQFPRPGSRDALCTLIGQSVTAFEYQEEVAFVLVFSGRHRISIPLDDASYRGTEALHWLPTPAGGPLEVW